METVEKLRFARRPAFVKTSAVERWGVPKDAGKI
jgi:hypothetical protein